jgi:hypothetical protein
MKFCKHIKLNKKNKDMKKNILIILIFCSIPIFCDAQINTPATWIMYELDGIWQIAIPPTLEIKNNEYTKFITIDTVAHNRKILKNLQLNKINYPELFEEIDLYDLDFGKYEDIVNLNSYMFILTFVPKKNRNNTSIKYSNDVSIRVSYMKSEDNDYYKSTQFPDIDLEFFDDLCKQHVLSIPEIAHPAVKLTKWQPVAIGYKINQYYFKQSYNIQIGNQPEMKIETYTFFNSDEQVEIIFSCRVSESNLWKSDFSQIVNTFNFKTKK